MVVLKFHYISSISNSRSYTEVVKLLKQFPDLDKMLTGLSITFKIATIKSARMCIDTLVFLKQVTISHCSQLYWNSDDYS